MCFCLFIGVLGIFGCFFWGVVVCCFLFFVFVLFVCLFFVFLFVVSFSLLKSFFSDYLPNADFSR